MMRTTIQALERQFAKHPVIRAAEGAPMSEISDAEASIGVRFPPEYAEFVSAYGGAIVGPYSIVGLRAAQAMGIDEQSIVMLTRRFRSQEWRGTDVLGVFSIDGAGNPIGFDTNGVIWICDHDAGEIVQIAADFESFLRTNCLKIPIRK